MRHPVADPLAELARWLERARRAKDPMAGAMSLATATRAGRPSQRMVLFKGLSRGGVTFYTNYESRKGRELAANPRAAVGFYWPTLERQVRIEGRVERLTREESAAYFHRRPRHSQIGAWASRQSRPVRDFADFVARDAAAERRFSRVERVPLPPYWGGFRLVPERIEFWIGRRYRLHERFVYTRRRQGWTGSYLMP